MRQTVLKLAAAAVGGAVATYFMQRGMKMSGKLPRRYRPPRQRDPAEFLVRQAERVVGRLPRARHQQAAQSLHWIYGVSWPVGLALLSSALGTRSAARTMLAGSALGALVWAVGYGGWLPAAGLVKPVHKVPKTQQASALMSHLAWGTLASVPLALASPRA